MYIPLYIIIILILVVIYFFWVKNKKEKSKKMVLVSKEWLSWLIIKTNELAECKPEDKFFESVFPAKVENLVDHVKEIEELSTIKVKK